MGSNSGPICVTNLNNRHRLKIKIVTNLIPRSTINLRKQIHRLRPRRAPSPRAARRVYAAPHRPSPAHKVSASALPPLFAVTLRRAVLSLRLCCGMDELGLGGVGAATPTPAPAAPVQELRVTAAASLRERGGGHLRERRWDLPTEDLRAALADLVLAAGKHVPISSSVGWQELLFRPQVDVLFQRHSHGVGPQGYQHLRQ